MSCVVMGWPQRVHGWGSRAMRVCQWARSARCGAPYPRSVVVPRLRAVSRWQVGHWLLPGGARSVHPVHGE